MFHKASQAAVVLAHQKDAHHRQENRDMFTNTLEKLIGPHTSILLLPEIKLVAESFYFWATVMSPNNQSLGEEYCDILQVSSNVQAIPKTKTRLLLFLCSIVMPYCHNLLISGRWHQIIRAFRPAQTAAERASEIRRRMMQRIEQSNENASQKSHSVMDTLKSVLLRMTGAASFASRFHLAMFYLKGEYYDLSKRISSVSFITTRPQTEVPASYRILGWLLLVQLSVELVSNIKTKLKDMWQAFYLESQDKLLSIQNETIPTMNINVPYTHATCGICLSTPNAISCPPCGHLFCYEHIMEATLAKSECPLCRQPARPNLIMRVYETL